MGFIFIKIDLILKLLLLCSCGARNGPLNYEIIIYLMARALLANYNDQRESSPDINELISRGMDSPQMKVNPEIDPYAVGNVYIYIYVFMHAINRHMQYHSI